MAPSQAYLIDTNILLRISRHGDPQHELIGASLKELEKLGALLCYAPQNIAEFSNVCTRPARNNGFGLSIGETDERVESIERKMTLLADSERVYSIWRRLVVEHNVRGVQVHDAHLAATMQAHGVGRILTLNGPDFLRYADVQAVHPSAVVS
jgi:predicted nucleic acid-binding protein